MGLLSKWLGGDNEPEPFVASVEDVPSNPARDFLAGRGSRDDYWWMSKSEYQAMRDRSREG